ncbi:MULTISPECIES: hypothetical protein [Roseivirga]|uniref:Uncharacterized protein n=1 Tax=Roseivirga spongicola TaxID=333140 RepID=A0A150XHL5_9BACT|nr:MULTISPECIES: hypothetical protein [Roseivirga]KYG78230.1 hypothetical protein AWW68_05545 [Roseivirga spongicola]MBO6660944.1 hypothetical protein [Roseivirga sp.]MBO6760028.1 hypothetical protein [Roseivirga sp.]MBO6909072.1 hypothetical protein [Roseivirga sp.]WPZ11977.1 hypothetical protein T7867_07625 [Roseivirga spongicola]
MKNYLIISFVAIILMGCSQEKQMLEAENATLITKLDSVSAELESTQKASVTLMSAMSLMDSINLSRQMMKVTLESSDQHADFLAQMTDLKAYVEQTGLQISKLEKTVKESRTAQSAYAQTIKTLKSDLESRKAEIASMETQLKSVEDNNQKLVVINKLQSETISSQDAEIAAKLLELEMLNQQITDLRVNFKLSEADAYYTQGEAYALAAQRTKLAPAKKKTSYQQALTAYQKALDLGKAEAQPKIEAIQARLK